MLLSILRKQTMCIYVTNDLPERLLFSFALGEQDLPKRKQTIAAEPKHLCLHSPPDVILKNILCIYFKPKSVHAKLIDFKVLIFSTKLHMHGCLLIAMPTFSTFAHADVLCLEDKTRNHVSFD